MTSLGNNTHLRGSLQRNYLLVQINAARRRYWQRLYANRRADDSQRVDNITEFRRKLDLVRAKSLDQSQKYKKRRKNLKPTKKKSSGNSTITVFMKPLYRRLLLF